MNSDTCERILIEGLKSYFASSANGLLVKAASNQPFLQIEVELILYNFMRISIFVEKHTIFYSISQSGAQLPLFKIELDKKLFIDSLPDLEKEVRLRIPDKYLKAKGY